MKKLIAEVAGCLAGLQRVGLVLPGLGAGFICFYRGRFCLLDLSSCLPFSSLKASLPSLPPNLPPELINLQAYEDN
jgi:hypothetical protein